MFEPRLSETWMKYSAKYIHVSKHLDQTRSWKITVVRQPAPIVNVPPSGFRPGAIRACSLSAHVVESFLICVNC